MEDVPDRLPQKIVIAGATGFIGRNLLAHYGATDDFDVRAVYHQSPPVVENGVNVEWVQADLTKDEDVRRAIDGADVIIQAAATTSGAGDIVNRPHIHTTDNAVMNSLLLRAAHDLGVGHFVFFSCSVMYQPGSHPVTEDDFDASLPLEPKYFAAGWTKLYIEKMCEFYAGLGRMKVTALRHSNVYGPHDKFDLERSHMFGATITKVLTEPDGGSINVWGDGTEARDLIYIEDLVRAVLSCLSGQEEPFGLFNVGAGQAFPVSDVVTRIIRASGKKLSINYDTSKPTIPFTLALDCSKIEQAAGWRSAVALDDGIGRTIAWWLQNPPEGTHARRGAN